MSFLSPTEDFAQRTLTSFTSALEKLAYMVELRRGDRYEHWGMIRTYGDDRAQQAMAAGHSEVFIDVLEKPLEQLAMEASSVPESSLQMLRERTNDALPSDLSGARPAHLNFVLESLWLVKKAARASSRRAA